MDLGAYGSDTATLNIDKLGPSGVMFTRYYTLPLCGPTCASLMTGQDNHVVGAGTLAEALTPKMRALPAYSMTWRDDQKTIASILKAHGYQMFVIGKWGVCYPFFGDLSFQAVHIPVQVPRAGIDRHNGVFNRGWDVMRKDVA
ncbi:MAG: sulfatase-like hydrolase/transferase [Myxococcota bacterium]